MTNSISRADGVAHAVQPGVKNGEAPQVVDQILEYTQGLVSTGGLGAVAQQLTQLWSGKTDAMPDTLRQHRPAMSSVKRQEAEAFLAEVQEQGFTFMDGMEALLVGSDKSFAGARASVSAQRRGILRAWLDSMMNELEAAVDGAALRLIREEKSFHDAVMREMCSPGSTESDDARDVADIFARHVEQARQRLNAAGADMGSLHGWTPQAHDPWELLKGGAQGREAWITFTAQRLDVGRSFPEAVDDAPQWRLMLGKVYDAIITGHRGPVSAPEKGQPTGRNLASGMDEHRVLHFADADAALAYSERYGQGNIIDAMVRHLDSAARRLALMERLGPDPQATLESLMATEQRRLHDAADMAPDLKEVQLGEMGRVLHKGMLRGKVAHWLAELSGEGNGANGANGAANPTLARVMSLHRATQTLTTLGRASLSVVGDVFVKASALRVNGLSWPESLGRSLVQHTGSYTGQNRKVARQLGIFMDFVLGDMHAHWDAGGGDTLRHHGAGRHEAGPSAPRHARHRGWRILAHHHAA